MADQEYKEFFTPIANALEEFANAHNLLVQKYYHDAPVWSLCFSHPNGGQAKLDVSKEENGNLSVQGVWWQDDYHAFTRRIMWGKKIEVSRDCQAVSAHLEKVFPEILRMSKDSLTVAYPDYKDIWGRYTKSEFEAMTPRWPSPKY
jgi:hypothetical protein